MAQRTCHKRTLKAVAFVVLIFSGVGSALSQAGTMPPSDMPRLASSLAAWAASLPHLQPGSIPTLATPQSRLMAFGRLVAALATRNWDDARKLSSELAYKVAMIQDSSGTYLGVYDP